MDKKLLGRFIKKRRKELNITQSEFAELLNVMGGAVSKWETGRSYPDIELLEPIAEILQIPIERLFEEARKEKNKVNIGPVAIIVFLIGVSLACAIFAGVSSHRNIKISGETEEVTASTTESDTTEYENNFVWPMSSSAITRYYSDFHNGIDIGCLYDDANKKCYVLSSVQGIVEEVGYDEESGNYIVIKSGDIEIRYENCETIIVKDKETVEAGDRIAIYEKQDKENATDFLHFGVKINGEYVNPIEFFLKYKERSSLTCVKNV